MERSKSFRPSKQEILMKRIHSILILLSTIAMAMPLMAQEQLNVKFNDPSRPGLLKINWANGSITVKTHNSNDVTIEARRGRGSFSPAPPEAGGLRRIDDAGRGLMVDSDTQNVITISGPSSIGNGNLEIEVPVKTNLNLQTRNGSSLTVEGVEGDIEATNRNGSVNLTNIAGSAVAYSMNGRVVVSFRDIAAGKPMSFTSMNGSVDVTLPSTSKANLKMRTDNGAIYTDFDIQMGPAATPVTNQDQDGHYRIQVDRTVTATVNGGGADFDLRTRNGNIYLRKAK
jgi:DUF4097 and DUF4098 domain-containing protein YvlB